jgi:hypothetical protein
MIQRQTSFRGFNQLQASGNSPFKRQLSLRLNELPSTLARQHSSLTIDCSNNGASGEGLDNSGLDEVFRPKSGVVPVQVLKDHLSQLYQLSEDLEYKPKHIQEANHHLSDAKFEAIAEADDETGDSPTTPDPIRSMCQQLSEELYLLSNKKNELQQLEKLRYNQFEENTSVEASRRQV